MEEFTVSGSRLKERIRELLHEGNVRRILIRNPQGRTLVDMPLTAGARLGSYEILSPLGAGGMGEVYRARDTKLNSEVAIKVLPESFASDPERLARFTREAQVLESLNHPNIAGEPFGLVLAEAMACGTPVAALDRGAVREIVDDKVTGLVFDDVDAMAEDLGRVLALDRQRVREHAVRRFGVARMVDEYVSAYRAILAGLRAPAP